jgi:hypothetical protein
MDKFVCSDDKLYHNFVSSMNCVKSSFQIACSSNAYTLVTVSKLFDCCSLVLQVEFALMIFYICQSHETSDYTIGLSKQTCPCKIIPIQLVSFTTNVVISKPVHCELDTTLCDKVRQLHAPGWWFSSPIKVTAMK